MNYLFAMFLNLIAVFWVLVAYNTGNSLAWIEAGIFFAVAGAIGVKGGKK